MVAICGMEKMSMIGKQELINLKIGNHLKMITQAL